MVRKTIALIAVGMVLMLVLMLCVQGIRKAEIEKYKLDKLFSGIIVPVESYVQPEYVQGPVYNTPLEAFNAFEASIKYGDDNFKVYNGANQYIDGWDDVWMSTKMSEMFRAKYGTLVGDCDCLAIDMCSWFLKSGFKAYVVVGTITLYDVDNLSSWGTFQHAWVKVLDPTTKKWYLAETVLESQVDALKEYALATTNYRAFWMFNNTSHSWGPTSTLFSKYPNISAHELDAVRTLYTGN